TVSIIWSALTNCQFQDSNSAKSLPLFICTAVWPSCFAPATS
ncbi:MAG: hypothetical protein ACI9F9_003443, partial [Candidatus Paceibacteria bacterium]